MANQHSKQTIIYVSGADISAYCDTSELVEGADVHDVTPYGSNAHRNSGGMRKGTFTMGGAYSTTATGTPKALLRGHAGETFTVIRELEGEGTGKPAETMSAVLDNYKTSAPVADMVRWSASFTIDGDVDHTAQAS